MTTGNSVLSQLAATSSSSSGFTVGDAITIFVLVFVACVVIGVYLVRRNAGSLVYRPEVLDEKDRRIRAAAEADIEAIEEDPGFVDRRDVPGGREDDL
jgi:hypothetical protein